MNTQDINFFDSEKIFELNPDMKVRIFNITDNHPVVLIDDVYKNPDMVREVALNTPVPLNTFFSARRGQLYNFFDNRTGAETLSKILIEGLKLDTCLPEGMILDNGKLFAFNVFEPKDFPYPPKKYVPPHSDGSIIASYVYLNKDDETPIGTGLYQHIPSGLIVYPQHDVHYEWVCQQDNVSPEEYIEKIVKYNKTSSSENKNSDGTPPHYSRGENSYTGEDTGEWKLLYESSGTYNQLFSHVAGTFHSPLIKNIQFGSANYNRINQVIFWESMDMPQNSPSNSY